MKKFIFALLVATTLWRVNAAEPTWHNNLAKAETQAKAKNKMVLMDFTGSDWCPWCIKLDKEVLDTKAFQNYAKKSLVLVRVDFPRHKKQSAELKKANKALSEKYHVSGFPTLVVLNKNGKEIGRQVGYAPGGPKAFIAKVQGFKSKD